MVLVDSSVWIALLRAQAGPAVDCLRRLLWDGEAVLAPVIVQEILQGAASPPQLERLREHFTGLPVLRSRDPLVTHTAAGALYARCRWAGVTPRSPHDCLIAQTAVEHDVALLHDDVDFERIAAVEPRLRLLRG
ncbi:Ribonuclease VapC11 [Tepidimonas sediminis]|uniref:Ribonuclease VapC n=1 Tax=Tepidimonas sediminis TaxID=2588941 RepID=A0A554WLD4_9BURK|nr:PIN domain-containing protein [Tepidimonas sediminis]TSE24369.1 Ribonuclease VapC11 [Tepidimonas sediminis]